MADHINHDHWKAAYLNELKRAYSETSDRVLNSVYFGGGTPSLMQPETVAEIIDFISKSWKIANNVEITLEANPSSVEREKFTQFKAAGINRVSLGLQALNDTDLKALGRLHTVSDGMKALEIAQNCFDQVSFDLIYARQKQSLQDWEYELNCALRFGADHISLYQLTIEPETAFGKRYKKGMLRGLPSTDIEADMYDLTADLTKKYGYENYEVSNYAKHKSYAAHNLIYWNYGDYVGIGPGAHGRLEIAGEKYETQTVLSPAKWLNQVFDSGTGEKYRAALDKKSRLQEYLIMSLRLFQGAEIVRIENLIEKPFDISYVQDLVDHGLIDVSNGFIQPLDNGRKLLNTLVSKIYDGLID